MAQLSYINLTYQSPSIDISESFGYNPDGTINIKYTLTTYRNLLQQNINIINALISEVDNITDIIPIDSNVAIKISSEDVQKKLFDNHILVQPNVEEDIGENYFTEEETNQDRLAMVDRITNQMDIPDNLEIISHSESGSDDEMDELIDDSHNMESIINKYLHIMGSDSSDSDCSLSEE